MQLQLALRTAFLFVFVSLPEDSLSEQLTKCKTKWCRNQTIDSDNGCSINNSWLERMREEKLRLDDKLKLGPHLSALQYCDGRTKQMSECMCSTEFEIYDPKRPSKVTAKVWRHGRPALAAFVISTLSERAARRVKNFGKEIGDYYVFGDKAPLMIVNDYSEYTSESTVSIQIQQHEPLHYLEQSKRLRQIIPVCAFFDINSSSWDSSVCNTSRVSVNVTECFCQHNSAFTVVFSITTVEVNNVVKMVSTILEIISVVVLALTIVLLIRYRRKQRDFDRVLVQISLCMSLAMAHVFLLLSQAAISNDTFCLAVIILSHYFLVTSLTFMVMEGGIILTRITFPNFQRSSHSYRRRILGFVVGWIIPIAYVGTCAGVGIQNGSYGNYIEEAKRFEVCWITDLFNLVVIIPVVIALVINVLVIIWLGIIIANLSRKAEEFKPTNKRDKHSAVHVGRAFRAAMVLLPVLGVPWILGLLINVGHPMDEIFAATHMIVNGCQGIFIFLHYVVLNTDMRDSVKISWKSAVSKVTSTNKQFITNNNDTPINVATERSANL